MNGSACLIDYLKQMANQMSDESKKLTEWAVVEDPDPWMAPELKLKFVVGILPDGQKVRTSAIHEANGRLIRTESGSLYELIGPPNAGYMQWLDSNGRAYDPECPIKVTSRKTKFEE